MLRFIAILIALLSSSAFADECRIEHHRVWHGLGQTFIEGAATCKNGTAYLRVYDKTGRYLGNALGEIQGYTMTAIMHGKMPLEVDIKYSVSLSPVSPLPGLSPSPEPGPSR